MAKYSIQDTTLTSIADAIRNKNGESTSYKPTEMAAAIAAIQGGGGGSVDVEPYVLTGDASYALSKCSTSTTEYDTNMWPVFAHAINTPGMIETKDITKMSYLCYRMTGVEELPFEINIAANQTRLEGRSAFATTELRKLPKINWNGSTVYANYFLNYLCNASKYLEDVSTLADIPEFYDDNISWSGYIFADCYSLRSIPVDFFLKVQDGVDTLKYFYARTCYCNYALDELINFPVLGLNETSTNMFSYTFNHCGRLKRLTFGLTTDGLPKDRTWGKQTIDLSGNIGYLSSASEKYLLQYSSSITADKKVTDAASYAALKDDPDWYTIDLAYSRYNHDSAVETINTLPNVTGGSNVIKFQGAAGASTDGGAINTLTEEEIAVATAKGWTVTLA